jgi:hypothetical protein
VLAASVLCVPLLVRPVAALPIPFCEVIEVSPHFASDGTAFCISLLRDETVAPEPLRVQITTDGGRSWRVMPATGLEPATRLGQVIVSPLFRQDRAVFVHTTSGLWRSTDLGATFSNIDTLTEVTNHNLAPFVTTLPGLPLVQSTPRVSFAYAERRPARIDAPLHLPVAGSPDDDGQFLVPPSYPADPAFSLSSRPTADLQNRQTTLYRCQGDFSCSELLFTFPLGLSFSAGWLAPDHATSREIYILFHSFPISGRVVMWRSTDGGATFREWTSVNQLIPTVDAAHAAIDIAGHPGSPRLRYLRISSTDKRPSPPAPPANRFFRSTDGGTTWHLMGSARYLKQPGTSPNRLPWRGRHVYASHTLRVAENGRLFLIGIGNDFADINLYCSVDSGRTWAERC